MEDSTRNKTYTTGSGKDVSSTKQLKGEANDSLTGKNEVKEYVTGSSDKGKLGGMPSRT
jgi:hypothetical protein